ncbi:hypothetical protein IJU85_02670 [Candidatus Saccharibacteria bacterium]|nr:hypothetical protein [Candidatus Saccharibacteria bacterium]
MNDGFINEDLLRDYINRNSYGDYNPNIKAFLQFLFGSSFDETKGFTADKKAGQMKPDLCISHNGIKKYVSIKKGSGNSVHQEKIDVFFPFFESVLGPQSLKDLKYFHYGDDTTNDSGPIRYSAQECKTRYARQIRALNSSINTSNNLSKFMDRFLFIGNVGLISVDAIYHGTISNGLWASKDEILDYVKNNTFSLNAVHFGPLTYQVWGRDEKRTAVHPDRRYVMQVKWGSITKDLEKIRKAA